MATIPSPGSTISEDSHEHMTTQSSPTRADPRTSLQHVLADPDSRTNTPSFSRHPNETMTEDEAEMRTPAAEPLAGGAEGAPAKATTGPRKRKDPATAGGAQSASAYSGNKIKHLKKDDGEPLWRKDIQYDFLKAVFDNDQEVFTNSYEPTHPKQSFANLYIDTMTRSSKTSKILRDKLLTEHEPAKNMAMVCLLVNLGRMNTTLNFFPEMRAQLRTYHAIPSLQAHQDPNSYKQLQDAPRLKSILKGASEDRPEPNTLEKIKNIEIPRTNPVNLIFVLAQFAQKITELHFPPGYDFYDVLMKTSISSTTRARAFLWLLWFYLESDFTEEGAEENPFGPGVDYGINVANQGVPRFDVLDEEQEALENVDTQEEEDYGYTKMRERKRIIEADQIAFQAEHGPPKRGPKPKLHLPPEDGTPGQAIFMGRIRPKYEEIGGSPAAGIVGRIRPKYESDMDSTRSTPPPRALGGMRIQSVLNTGSKPRGSLKNQIIEGSSPVAHLGESIMRRSRPLTAHQLAVEQNRNQRVDYILSRGIRKKHHHARKIRKQEGGFWRALQRTKKMNDPFEDSEDEEGLVRHPGGFRERGFGGLVQLETEEDDFGEEMSAYAAAIRRMGRRLDRWDSQKDLNLGVMGTNRISQNKNDGEAVRDNDETEDEGPRDDEPIKVVKKRVNGVVKRRVEQEEGDMEGDMDVDAEEVEGRVRKFQGADRVESEVEGEEEEEVDEGLDEVDKALLGLPDVDVDKDGDVDVDGEGDGDETEDEMGGSDGGGGGGMDVD